MPYITNKKWVKNVKKSNTGNVGKKVFVVSCLILSLLDMLLLAVCCLIDIVPKYKDYFELVKNGQFTTFGLAMLIITLVLIVWIVAAIIVTFCFRSPKSVSAINRQTRGAARKF